MFAVPNSRLFVPRRFSPNLIELGFVSGFGLLANRAAGVEETWSADPVDRDEVFEDSSVDHFADLWWDFVEDVANSRLLQATNSGEAQANCIGAGRVTRSSDAIASHLYCLWALPFVSSG